MTRLSAFALCAVVVAAGTDTLGQGAPSRTISILSTNAIVGPLTTIVEEHNKGKGPQINVEFDTSPSINRRFAAGKIAGVHVLVAANGTVDQAIKDGKAIADSRVRVGRVGVGVAIRRGGVRPDISSVDALKASLLKADAIVYSQGASGVYTAQLLDKLGLLPQLKGKTVQLTSGADMIERVEHSKGNEIGLTQISEITRAVEETKGGIVYVGPLPAAIQNYTIFDAVVMTGSPNADVARAFVKSLAAPAARKLLAANAWEF
jgi:molybdate transport system substrate-binding protein